MFQERMASAPKLEIHDRLATSLDFLVFVEFSQRLQSFQRTC